MPLALPWKHISLLLCKKIGRALLLWLVNLIFFVVVLLYCCAIRQVLFRIPGLHSFPASVVGMVLLYLCLVLLTKLSRPTSARLLRLFQPRAEFCLKYMNIMFVPSTLNIINSQAVTGVDFIKVAVFFVIVYALCFTACIFLVRCLRFVMYFHQRHQPTLDELNERPSTTARAGFLPDQPSPPQSQASLPPSEVVVMDLTNAAAEPSVGSPDPDEEKARTAPTTSHTSLTIHYLSTAASTIADQANDLYQLKPSMNDDDDDVDYRMDLLLHQWWHACQPSVHTSLLLFLFSASIIGYLGVPNNAGAFPFFSIVSQVTLTVLVYVAGTKLPLKVRMILHPIIITTAVMLAALTYLYIVKADVIYPNAAKAAVSAFYTNRISFYSLIEGSAVGWPGAGDILSSAMNVAIVSLALTVYQNSPSNWRDWLTLVLATFPMCFISLLLIPFLAHAVVIPNEICLALTTRTVTTAIGIAISEVIHSNVGIATCIQFMSAISGPLIGARLLKLFKVPKDDYLTIGVSMGFNSHALGTSYLYETNRSASSISSLSFMLFGTFAVVFVSIPAIASTVMSITGY
ncbi:hypothetical protein DM01DRAFT_1338046 [Hesseltinella vesiculosa]|uniref:LrgB-domain-containing protein n=1 Tax=Hesseltinella vesiculosa TaxID=101127 RepID=A0A1X2GCS2_9FUNG|nr:hypothetical protein DM01DRAFT_1338046 [Hesseltinella vesiculosa]